MIQTAYEKFFAFVYCKKTVEYLSFHVAFQNALGLLAIIAPILVPAYGLENDVWKSAIVRKTCVMRCMDVQVLT